MCAWFDFCTYKFSLNKVVKTDEMKNEEFDEQGTAQ